MNKVVVIGCGNVGMSYSYALLNQKTPVNELVLIDMNISKLEGEVMDLNHCLAFAPSKINIKVGDYKDVKEADIVVITASAPEQIHNSRMDLIDRNSKIIKDIVEKVIVEGFNGIFLVATNPLDVMTYLTYKYSNFDSRKVIGSGTCLDTARLRYIIGKKLEISPKNIHGYVIGEHGDSEFIPWSNVFVGTKSINEFLSESQKENIENDVRNSAYEIIKRKGNTSYGIGICLAKITNSILNDENNVLSISRYEKQKDVYIGGAAVISRSGVKKIINLKLNKNEHKKYLDSVNTIKAAIKKVL